MRFTGGAKKPVPLLDWGYLVGYLNGALTFGNDTKKPFALLPAEQRVNQSAFNRKAPGMLRAD